MSSATDQIESLRQQVARLQRQLDALRQSEEAGNSLEPQTALRQAHAFHLALIDGVAEGICACYVIEEFPYVRFAHWNRRMSQITGYTMEEINRLGWYQTLYPDAETSNRAAQRMERMRAGDHLVAEEWEIVRKDGERRTIAISTTFIHTEDGRPAVAAMMQDVSQRKQAERALLESQHENELLLESIPDMLLRVQRDGTYLSFKPATGFRPWKYDTQVVGKNIRDSIPPDIARRALELVEKAIDTELPQQMEVCLATEGGQLYRDVRIVPSANEQALIIIRDVTREKKATLAYSQSQHENKLLLAAIPDLLIRMRGDGTFVWAKAPPDFPLLMPLDDTIGKQMHDILPAEIADPAMKHIRSALATQAIETFQYVLPFDDGTTHWEARVIPSDEDEVLVIVRDVTQRRRAEVQRDNYVRLTEAIRRVQSQYISRRSAQELYDDVLKELIALTESEYGFIGEVLTSEEGEPYLRTLAMTDLAWNETPPADGDSAAPPRQEFPGADALFGQLLRTQDAVILNNPAKDSHAGGVPEEHPAWHSFLGVPITQDGQVIGVAGLSNRPGGFDATLVEYVQPFLSTCASLVAAHRHQAQRLAAEQLLSQQESQLAHATRLKTLGEMVAAMAHEMTQPLAAISNYAAAATMQASRLPGGTALDIDTWLERISEQSARGGEIIERLRRFAKRSEPQFEPAALDGIVVEAIKLVDFHMRRHGSAAELVVTGKPFEVTVDRIQIQQVIVNLISNACEAMSAAENGGNTVKITLTYDEADAIISIKDDGPGIEPAAHDRVFDPFVTTKPDGIGMGLAICRSVIEAHSGQIWHTCNSTRGTTFHVRLTNKTNSIP